MRTMLLAVSIGLLPAVEPKQAAAAPAIADIAVLTGTWSVVAVEVPDEGVQALLDDDPAYMGREIAIGPDAIAWLSSTTGNDDATEEDCAAPVLAPAGDGSAESYGVTCADGGSWGPDATLVLRSADEVALDWYDNGTLVLQRQD